MKYPVFIKNNWYHVGDLSKKVIRNSYEGSGLSVSYCPDSWRKIASLSGELFYLKKKKKKGRFLDFYSLDKKEKEKIIQWALNKKYLERKLVWISFLFDDEYDDFFVTEYESLEELKYEIAWNDRDEEEQAFLMETNVEKDKDQIFCEKRYYATSKLLEKEEWSGSCNSSISMDFAVMRYANEKLSLDGVFWDEEHDVNRLSAPRAVIFQEKLHTWILKKEVS